MNARETVTLQRPSELEVAEFGITNKKMEKMEKQITLSESKSSRRKTK